MGLLLHRPIIKMVLVYIVGKRINERKPFKG
jgi:hypothetical protein